MKIFWPFSRSGREWESGNVLLLTGMIATATAVAGGKVMLDRTLAQRKASQLAENTKRAKEIPGSAAMIAKALISLPPHVSGNKSLEWTSDNLQSVPKNRPRIYPIPYTSGTVGGPAQPATAVSQSATPESGANWKMPEVENTSKEGGAILSAQVYVYTNDSSRTATQDVNSAISSKSVAGGSETIKRTESLVTYSFRNCDEDNRSSPTFTGRYCASAIIETDNYATSVKGKDTATGTTNKVAVELGGIESPPPPVIKSVSTSDNGPLRKNTNFSLVVKATGVATGYTVKYGGTELATTWPNKMEPIPHKRLTFDHPYETRELVISDIGSSALNAVFDDPCVNSVTLEVTLHGITGPDPKFPQSFDVVKNLVSCVPGSFKVTRTGADQRSCSFELRKDSNPGTIESVLITQQNNRTNAVTSHTFASPSFASNNKWTNPTSPAFVCSEDSLTFSGALERESSCPTPSISQCTPTNVNIPELLPVCSTFSAGRTPGTLTECTLTIDRAPNSHSVVDIFVNNTLQTGGNWSGNKWTMTNYSCGLGASSFTARLARGANSVPCGSESVNVSAISWCNPNSTFVKRVPGDPSKCTMRLTKNSNAAVADITSKKVSTTTLAASTSITGGTWATHEWTSPQFNCPLGQTSYLGSLTGKDNRVSECGWSVLPSEPPVCGDFNFTRPTPTSTTCNLTMKKGLDSGPITEARLNGGVMSPADQDTYTTTVQCPLNSSTTVTGSLTNARGTVTCGPATVPAAVCYSDAVGGVSSETLAAGRKYRIHRFASVGASQNFQVTSNCKPFEVLVVAGGGGGGTGRAAGGGGAGGVIYNTNYQFSSTGSFPVTVGAGGAVNARGSNSSIAQILIAQGGGFGGRGEGQSPQSGGTGGSGGGGGFKGNFGAGAGTPNQGYNGGKNRNGNWIGGGGGGGFAGQGKQAGMWSSAICAPLPSCGMGGPGGIGLGTSISGTPRNYAGGGSGCGEQKRGEISSFGGGQGGRDDKAGSSGLAGTGGGGGGCGGAGGSGVVIIRYEIAP